MGMYLLINHIHITLLLLINLLCNLNFVILGQEFLFPVPAWVSQVFLETGLLGTFLVGESYDYRTQIKQDLFDCLTVVI